MLTKKKLLAILNNHMPYFTAEYGVKRMAIFGSYAKNCMTPDSDVDIMVEFERPIGLRFVELADHLEQLFNKKVDILTWDSLDNIRIKQVANSIRESIVYVPTN